MATSDDVAKLAGVSQATVSRVFSNSPRISAATQERVRAAAAHLGYSPNVIAQTLKRPYAHTIALGFFPENGSTLLKLGDSQFYFFMGVLQAIERESAQLGFDILLPPRPAHSPHE